LKGSVFTTSKIRKEIMPIRKGLSVFALLLLVFGCNQALNAQRNRGYRGDSNPWTHLGDKHVDGHADHDKISIGKSEGRFRQLQIRVYDAPVEVQRVVVHFDNGADEELQFRERINAGGETHALDLRGYDRVIKSVEFWYEKAHWRERRPTVALFGR
jgi:hypothetical protein